MTQWKDENELLAEQLRRAFDRPVSSDDRFDRLLKRIETARRRKSNYEDAA